MSQKVEIYKLGADGIILYNNRIYVPNVQDLKRIILHEMHNVPYAGLLGVCYILCMCVCVGVSYMTTTPPWLHAAFSTGR
jgi:hypothetical protein